MKTSVCNLGRIVPDRGINKVILAVFRVYLARRETRIAYMTPQEVLDQFLLLTPQDKTEFIKLLGAISSAESPYAMASALGPIEFDRFSGLLFEEFANQLFPLVLHEARRIARETAGISDEDFEQQLLERVSEVTEQYDRIIGEREAAKLKAKRDRKSNPKIARRNVEICDLRRSDPKLWSQGRLAKKYGKTARYIRKILDEEAEWRAIVARGPTS